MINDKSKRVSTFRSGKINNWKYFFDEEITKKFNDTLPGPLDTILKKMKTVILCGGLGSRLSEETKKSQNQW